MTSSYVTVTPGSDPLSQTTVVTPTYPSRQNVSYVTTSPQTEYVTTTPSRTTSRLVTKYVDEQVTELVPRVRTVQRPVVVEEIVNSPPVVEEVVTMPTTTYVESAPAEVVVASTTMTYSLSTAYATFAYIIIAIGTIIAAAVAPKISSNKKIALVVFLVLWSILVTILALYLHYIGETMWEILLVVIAAIIQIAVVIWLAYVSP